MHLEVRVSADGSCIPIEVNPMRFAGWCTTDLAHYAYGLNVYEDYFRQTAPNWAEIESAGPSDTYALVVAEVPPGIDRTRALAIDWDCLLAGFSNPLEVRPINYREYPVAAFLFVKIPDTAEGAREVQRILHMDMNDYVTVGD